MNYKLKDVIYETADFWVLRVPNGGFEVYQTGLTHSTRCAQIGYKGENGKAKAIAECNKRQEELSE